MLAWCPSSLNSFMCYMPYYYLNTTSCTMMDDKVPNGKFNKGTPFSLFNCIDSWNGNDLGDWCCGFWCLPCLLGQNTSSEYLPQRDFWTDCCVPYCLSVCWVGACLTNNWQRKDLKRYNVVNQDGVGSCICAPCVACETARALNYLRQQNVPVPVLGLVDNRLLPAVVVQPTRVANSAR